MQHGEIAKRFGVSISTVQKLSQREKWSELKEEFDKKNARQLKNIAQQHFLPGSQELKSSLSKIFEASMILIARDISQGKAPSIGDVEKLHKMLRLEMDMSTENQLNGNIDGLKLSDLTDDELVAEIARLSAREDETRREIIPAVVRPKLLRPAPLHKPGS